MNGYREVFRPEPAADYHDPGKIFYTITEADIGKGVLQTTAESITVHQMMGRVQAHDVGRRLYRVPIAGTSHWAWQLENNDQRQARLDEKRFKLS